MTGNEQFRFNIHTNIQKALNKIKVLQNKVQKNAELTSNELCTLGQLYARADVPYYTGKTYRYIVKFDAQEGRPAKIVAKNPTIDGHQRNIPNFNLVRWMHTAGIDAAIHFHSGNRFFMYNTRDYLNRIKKGVAIGRFKSIKLI